jgi:SAM-dependent methyltransferase
MREIEAGHYEAKQLRSPSKVIAWSHSSRFDVARQLLAPLAGRRLLDYGAGDGTLLKLVADEFPGAVGADPIPSQVSDARRRFGGSGLSFYTMDELHDQYAPGSFDVITCMEVLEHCTNADVEKVLDDLARLLAPGGTLIISVPIEIGPSLLIKQTARRLASLRGLGDYAWTEHYSIGELLRMIFATSSTAIQRPTHVSPDVGLAHGHKGFNWRALERRIRTRLAVDRRLFSPLGLLGGFFSSQAWFVCRPKAATRG